MDKVSMPLSIKGTLNWQEYLSEKEKNAGKWSREGKNGQNQMYFFPYNFRERGRATPGKRRGSERKG